MKFPNYLSSSISDLTFDIKQLEGTITGIEKLTILRTISEVSLYSHELLFLSLVYHSCFKLVNCISDICNEITCKIFIFEMISRFSFKLKLIWIIVIFTWDWIFLRNEAENFKIIFFVETWFIMKTWKKTELNGIKIQINLKNIKKSSLYLMNNQSKPSLGSSFGVSGSDETWKSLKKSSKYWQELHRF